jgi:hypothetical protein
MVAAHPISALEHDHLRIDRVSPVLNDSFQTDRDLGALIMNSIIYIVGLVVVVGAVLSFFGLR